ncbi:aminotransferase class IV [Segetibacter sp. 3557_3]|uniref:aminotransferase class IV n=1 Tax=Segetibacter sp. 3557_3 TaxID=2547429 RepID=UPI00140450FC|nr:aminotransferase class IV [Segetibacter sp. 3557_3]
MNNTTVIINGEFTRQEDAALYINDLSITRGYGVFDFFKTIGGHPIFFDDHLTRFYASAAYLNLAIPFTPDQLKAQIMGLMANNNMPDSGIRLTLTGGYSADGFNPGKPNLVITQQPLVINPELTKGIRLITYEHQRQLPSAKSIDYLMAIWLQPLIKQEGADDVLYHQQGTITECPRSNIFMVNYDNTIATPGRDMLKGVIRKQLVERLDHGYRLEERAITLAELYSAKEVFITSTTKNIMPVIAIDRHVIGSGKAGTVSTDLNQQLQKLIETPNPEQVQIFYP